MPMKAISRRNDSEAALYAHSHERVVIGYHLVIQGMTQQISQRYSLLECHREFILTLF